MKFESKMGSVPTKRVYVSEVTTADTDDEIMDFAMAAVRETRSGLYGWFCERHADGTATVTLHTD